MKNSNRKIGNSFESELCEKLYTCGFWAHNMAQNKAGQPADVIAVRNSKAYLIDAKVCSDGGFKLSRIEENQDLAMTQWSERGNGVGWFAIKINGEIYMICHHDMALYAKSMSILSYSDIRDYGIPFDRWVRMCK